MQALLDVMVCHGEVITQWHSITSHKIWVSSNTAVRISNFTITSTTLKKHFIWTMCISLIKRKDKDLHDSSASHQLFLIFWDAVQHQWVNCYRHARPLKMGHACSPETSETNYLIMLHKIPQNWRLQLHHRKKPKISNQRGISPSWLDSFSLLWFLSVSMISDMSDTWITISSVLV